MNALGVVCGLLMMLLALINNLPEPRPRSRPLLSRRRAGGIGYNRKARR